MLIARSTLDQLEASFVSDGAGFSVASVEVRLDPLEFVRSAHSFASPAVYFGRPGETEIGAIGSTWEAQVSSGEGRLARLADEIPNSVDARFVLGYSFSQDGPTGEEWSNYGPARVVLPQAAVVRDRGSTKLIVATNPGDESAVLDLLRRLKRPGLAVRRHAAGRSIESIPPPGDWMQAVEETVEAIEAGAFEKVVLARSVVVTSDVASDPFELAGRLRSGYSGCFTYAWESGEDAFVGASPELLAQVRGARVISEPLAGTTARGEGEDDDRQLGEQLMASTKNRHEHRLVIEDISSRLEPLTSEISVPSTPTLRRMANVQHLSTSIQGTLLAGRGLLDVVEAMHPTPAVGGSPTSDAVAMIEKMEQIDRGWYSGGIGWTTAEGDGQVAVALRCALLRGAQARLFAGAGIVSGSIPQLELEETRLKFGPVLSLLTEA